MDTNTATIDLSTIPTDDILAALHGRKDALVIAFTPEDVELVAEDEGIKLTKAKKAALWDEFRDAGHQDTVIENLNLEIAFSVRSAKRQKAAA